MNILYTESSPDIGGQELQAIAQMQAMTRARHQVVLACRADSRIAEEAEKHAIKVIPVPFRNSLHPPSVYALRRLVQKLFPDMVICHSRHDSNIVALTRATLSWLTRSAPASMPFCPGTAPRWMRPRKLRWRCA
ncbi:glycosyltransferase [Salmonella enterica]|nr:glycosyltransferase [Salmonella enterica]EHQ8869563.1 glycosyltransferase [Salmonella enterica]